MITRSVLCFSCFGLMLLAATALLGQESVKKAPIPDDKAQVEALALIRDVYKEEYSQTTTAEKKAELAKQLLQKAGDTKDDLTNQFVLLRVARDLGAQAGDVDTAFQAVDEMAAAFSIDPVEMKVEVLTKVASVTKKNDEQEQIVEAALSVINQAIAQDKYEIASRLGRLALSAAQKARDAALVKRTRTRIKAIGEASKAFQEAEASMKTLEEKPLDPEANLIAGKYLCFIKGKWKQGRSMLALGSDATLKALALKEMEGIAAAAEQVKLGDGWWNVAEKEDGVTQKNLQDRAGYWYKKALPGLSGLVKDKVAKRIASLAAEENPPKSEKKPSHLGVARVVYLDDLQATVVKAGWGKLGLHGRNAAGDQIFLNGTVPAHSLCQAPPDNGYCAVAYRLDGKFTTFSSAIMHDPKMQGAPSALTFVVLGDGKVLWKSTPLTFGQSTACKAYVRRVNVLTLQVHCSGSNLEAHGCWIDPSLSSGVARSEAHHATKARESTRGNDNL